MIVAKHLEMHIYIVVFVIKVFKNLLSYNLLSQ